jgi:hypothetical protein
METLEPHLFFFSHFSAVPAETLAPNELHLAEISLSRPREESPELHHDEIGNSIKGIALELI